MLPDDKNDVASVSCRHVVDETFDIERINRLVVGLRTVVSERLIVEHQAKARLFKPAVFPFDLR